MTEPKQDDEMLLRLFGNKDISEIISLAMRSGNRYSKRILKFFREFCKWFPPFAMCVHGYAMLDFSHNHYDMFHPYDDNWMSYAFTYFMLYILPFVILPASRFFHLCWRYRIPFFYFFGVNAIHIGYWSWYTTNEMAMAHRCLLIMIAGFYLYGFIELFLDSKLGRKIF